LLVNREMNLLSLVNPWLDSICQIKTKCYSTRSQIFWELNKALMNSDMFCTGCMHGSQNNNERGNLIELCFFYGGLNCVWSSWFFTFIMYIWLLYICYQSPDLTDEVKNLCTNLCNRSRPNRLNKFFPNCISTTNGVASVYCTTFKAFSPKPSAPSQVFLKFEQPVQNSPIQYHIAIKT